MNLPTYPWFPLALQVLLLVVPIVLNFDSAKPISVALLATLIPTSIGSKFLEHPLEACTSPIRLLRFRVAAFELF